MLLQKFVVDYGWQIHAVLALLKHRDVMSLCSVRLLVVQHRQRKNHCILYFRSRSLPLLSRRLTKMFIYYFFFCFYAVDINDEFIRWLDSTIQSNTCLEEFKRFFEEEVSSIGMINYILLQMYHHYIELFAMRF